MTELQQNNVFIKAQPDGVLGVLKVFVKKPDD